MDGSWFVVVDNRRGRLLRAGTTNTGRPQIDEHDVLENTREPHQRGRPSRLAGKTGQMYAHWGHEEEERQARFARDVMTWIGERMEHRAIGELTLFAPPRLLGALRQQVPPALGARLELEVGDLAGLGPAELLRHPAIVRRTGAVGAG